MKNSLLKKIIFEELSLVLKELAPEAPKNAVFGKYLWADKKIRKVLRNDDVNEPDTKEEKDFLDSYIEFVDDPGATSGDKLANVISKFLKPAKQNGQYTKYIGAPNGPLYRGLNLTIEDASKLLGIPTEEIIKYKYDVGISGPGSVKNISHNVMSWSITPPVAVKFAIDVESNYENQIAVVLISDKNNGDFYLNPVNINRKFEFKATDFISTENEVISYGPVKFKSAAFMFLYSVEPKDMNMYVKNLTNKIFSMIIEKLKNGDKKKEFEDFMSSGSLALEAINNFYSLISDYYNVDVVADIISSINYKIKSFLLNTKHVFSEHEKYKRLLEEDIRIAVKYSSSSKDISYNRNNLLEKVYSLGKK